VLVGLVPAFLTPLPESQLAAMDDEVTIDLAAHEVATGTAS
jgi:hypothetical protein